MSLPSISLGHEVLSRFEEAVKKEWIVTNGLGGYASSTVLSLNTRKYHGLLVAAFHPPSDRRVCLEKLDEEMSIGNKKYSLGVNEFQNATSPQDCVFPCRFVASPFPAFTYSMTDVEVQKTIFMPCEKNAVVVLYNVLNASGSDVKLRVFPLLNWRHFHAVTERRKVCTGPVQSQSDRETSVEFDSPKSALVMTTIGGSYVAEGKWVEGLFYREEAARGESCLDDCYRSGFFSFEVKAGRKSGFAVVAVADENMSVARKIMTQMPTNSYDANALLDREVERHKGCLKRFGGTHPDIRISEWLSALVLATDMFIVKRSETEKSVIAGYHWFESWGRDTFISLPGLMLVTERFQDARKVFLGFTKYCNKGLIPNFVPDSPAEPAYNSVDASLWFVNAVLQYLKYTGDFGFVREQLWETLRAIIDSHLKGTFFNIHVDDDGLLCHGERLTWMDAAVDSVAVTPRAGKAVEVQALWYNALRIMELLANSFGEKSEAERYATLAERTGKSFAGKFWNSERNCLFDVVNDKGRDDSLRPNQILAVSLDFTMLDDTKNELVVDLVQREFLTPFGLRTLAKSDARYVRVYGGDRCSRDKAYHNGTVWPWLLGPFTTAFMKTRNQNEHDHTLRNLFRQLSSNQILKAGLGTVNEVFDGDSPHTPKGCIAQAWSVAEPLRAYVEDFMQDRPRYETQVL